MPALRALRPFAHREYRVLITALAISIFGSGMWAVAMVYEVIHLGGGPLELSVVAAAGSVGLVTFLLAGGIAADRLPQRLLIIAVEGANLAVVAAVSGLALAGLLELWHLALGAFVLGVGAAFFFPAYSAILPRILPPEDLLAANGMEGTMRPILQQAAGPAVAGILVAALSPAHAVTGVAACHLLAFCILNLLRRIQAERGLSVIFISHDLGLVRYLTETVLVMKDGFVVEEGNTDQVLNQPAHDYTQRLIASALA